MEKRLCSILLALCLLLALCGCDGGADVSADPSALASETDVIETAAPDALPTPELSQRERDWIEDIEFLREEYKTRHIDPFYLCSEEEFDWKLDQLAAKVGQLSVEDLYFELTAIVSEMGDRHTFIAPFQQFDRRFPVTAQYFGGKLCLCGYLEGYEQFEPYLLREIVAVNGVDISYLNAQFQRLVSPDNKWASQEMGTRLYFVPAFFDWAGCDHTEGYTFHILNDDQEVELVEVPTIPMEPYPETAFIRPEGWEAISYLKGGNWAEYFQGENGGYVYLSFTEMSARTHPPYTKLFQTAAELMEAHPECSKLVIDLRRHPGGDMAAIDYVRQDAPLLDVPSIEHTYVLTSGYTASGAMGCISIFQEALGAVTVGEPTGQFPSFFVQFGPTPVTLPHTQLDVYICNSWWDGTEMQMQDAPSEQLYEWQNTVLPDVFVYQDIEDVRQGKDSVIQWVLAQ